MRTRIGRNTLSGAVAGAGLATILASLLLVPTAQPAQAAVGDLTDSAVTLKARDLDPYLDSAPMPNLEVTVSQTKDLVLQGVMVSWKGAEPNDSRTPTAYNPGVNYLEVFQCWGDDPQRPGQPDKTTCQYGGFNTIYSARLSQHYVDPLEDPAFAITAGSYRGGTLMPFRAVDDTVLGALVDGAYVPKIVDNQRVLNENEYFGRYTTNEAYAKSGPDGTGSLEFEVQTGLEAPGLGCGEVQPNGTPRSCWLVVVPRGSNPTVNGYNTLLETAWRHKLAVKLAYKPIGLRCPIGQAERAIGGSELLADAVSSWQPVLCGSAGGATYTYALGTESDAVNRLVNGAGGLALTQRPADLAVTGAVADPLAYAPVGLGGVAVGFAFESLNTGYVFPSLNLTPRLIAKLLTNSYKASLPTYAPTGHLGGNPQWLTRDPDFLAVNDKAWTENNVSGFTSDLLVPLGRSDIARALWEYVLVDEAARAWLAGEPDNVRPGDEGNLGMVVNPWYASTAEKNAVGAAMEYPRDDFPKADPSERKRPNEGVQTLLDWRPYTADFATGAYDTLRGDQLMLGDWDSYAVPVAKFKKLERSLPGDRRVMSVTLTSAAARYQVRTAALRNPAGEFVAPTETSLLAAAAAFTGDPDQPQVLRFDPTSEQAKVAKNAYPLALAVYAAADPEHADADARADYAAFIRYAATSGQTPGTSPGELPKGYAPLPAAWRAQALAAADVIEHGWPEEPEPGPSAATVNNPLGPGDSAARAATAPDADPALPATGDDPRASGRGAGSLVGAATPADPAAMGGPAVTVGVISGAAAVAAAPLIGRLRRPPRVTGGRR